MHYNNENLIEDFLTSLKHVLLDLQLFDCCIPKSDKIIKINVPKTIYKEGKYAASKNTIAESILNEPESFPPLDVKCIEQESINFLARSCPLEREFLTTLVNTYIGTISTGPSDIGKITKKIYHVDIELLDKSNPLPLDLPYPTNDINKLACARIVQTWLAAGIVESSQLRTHGSQLTVAKKHLSETDFSAIKERLKKDSNIEIHERSEIFRQNPEIFTDSEIGKIFRVCLDVPSLNVITRPEFTCSPNSEQVVSELISLDSEEHSKLENSNSSDCPALSQFLDKDNIDNIDDNELYFSSLDIKSAHSSLLLTDRASFFLNAILPDYTTIRFLRSPFGLKCVNSKFNFVLPDILANLIKKHLVIIYSNDVLLVC